jgi:hypothetical protein
MLPTFGTCYLHCFRVFIVIFKFSGPFCTMFVFACLLITSIYFSLSLSYPLETTCIQFLCCFVSSIPVFVTIPWTSIRTNYVVDQSGFKKPFRVSSTNRSTDSMPGTPATFASYCDPSSPSPSLNIPHSRSDSLVAKIDMDCGGGGNESENSGGSDGGHNGTKAVNLLSRT